MTKGKKLNEVLERLARQHKKNAGYPHSLIVGYADQKSDSAELHLLEVYGRQVGPVEEPLVRYRFARGGSVNYPVSVVPCSWNELEVAAKSHDRMLREFMVHGRVLLAHSSPERKKWESLKAKFYRKIA